MKKISIILIALSFFFMAILNLSIGCFQDRDFLLKQMFHKDFPSNYVLEKKSESTLLDILRGKGSCSYDIKISQKDFNNLHEKIVGTKFWKKSHPSWSAKPCKNLSDTICDPNKIENIQVLEKTGLICFATAYPRNFTVKLSCRFL